MHQLGRNRGLRQKSTQGWGRRAAMGDRWIGRWGALCQMGLRPTEWSRTLVASYHMMFSSYSINSCHLLCLNPFCIAFLFFVQKLLSLSVLYVCGGREHSGVCWELGTNIASRELLCWCSWHSMSHRSQKWWWIMWCTNLQRVPLEDHN
jgi:hypothetical protein